MDSDAENKTTAFDEAFDAAYADQAAKLDIDPDTSGNLSHPGADQEAGVDLQEMGKKLREFLDMFPDQVNETFELYKKPITTGGILLAALLSVAIADGVLDVLNAVPLIAPLLELVGLGYTGWFAWHYLRYAESRQQLLEDYRAIKNRIIGKTD